MRVLHSILWVSPKSFPLTSVVVLTSVIGPAVSVMGSNLGSAYARWACFMDGISFEVEPLLTTDGNNRYICSKYAMDDGPHSITVRAIVSPGTNQTFWFDRIEYLPSAGRSLTNVTTAVWSSDSAPRYDSSWIYKENTCRMTTQHGATATFDFYGLWLNTGLLWSTYEMWF